LIEKVLILIIQELGPIGLLIAGLYLVLERSMQRIEIHLAKINEEIGELCDLIADMLREKDGKN